MIGGVTTQSSPPKTCRPSDTTLCDDPAVEDQSVAADSAVARRQRHQVATGLVRVGFQEQIVAGRSTFRAADHLTRGRDQPHDQTTIEAVVDCQRDFLVGGRVEGVEHRPPGSLDRTASALTETDERWWRLDALRRAEECHGVVANGIVVGIEDHQVIAILR